MKVFGFTKDGMIEAEIDGINMFVPDDIENRDRQAIAEWEAAGNIIPPYLAPLPATADVDAERDQRIAAGFTYNGVFFQSRQFDLDNIRSMATAASVKIVQGAQDGDLRWFDPEADFYWIAADNSHVQMSAPEMVAFAMVAATWGSKHILAASALKKMTPIPADYEVIPPLLTGLRSRIHAAIFSFCAGVTPPMPILGRSLL